MVDEEMWRPWLVGRHRRRARSTHRTVLLGVVAGTVTTGVFGALTCATLAWSVAQMIT